MARKTTENPSTEGTSTAPSEKKKRRWFGKFLVFLIIVGLAGATGYYYKQYKKIKDNPQAVSQEETQVVISEVGKLMELPNETPSLATVQDKDKLKDQTFFQKAENGDKVLIYTNAKQAILYRPSAKKIIEVAPLILNSNDNNGGTAQNSNGNAGEDKTNN